MLYLRLPNNELSGLSTDFGFWWTCGCGDVCLSTDCAVWWTNSCDDACLSTDCAVWWTNCRLGVMS